MKNVKKNIQIHLEIFDIFLKHKKFDIDWYIKRYIKQRKM